MIDKSKFDVALERLKLEARNCPQISKKFKNILFNSIMENKDTLPIVSNKFKLTISFLKFFIESLVKYQRAKNDVEFQKLERKNYRDYKRLKKYSLIHKYSVSYYPKSLSLVSINPNHSVLLSSSFNKLNRLNQSINLILAKRNTNNKTLLLYIYLRIFHIVPFSKNKLKKLQWQDLVRISDECALFIIYQQDFFGINQSDATPRPYKIVLLDNEASLMLNTLFNQAENEQFIFNDIEQLEEKLQKNKKRSTIHDITLFELKVLNKLKYMFNTSPLALSIRTGIVQSVPLSLAEIEALYPGKINKILMEEEKTRVHKALSRPEKEKQEWSWQFITFDIYDLVDLTLLLKHPSNVIDRALKHLLANAIQELNQGMNRRNNRHLELIYDYLLYLLNLVQNGRIRLSTTKNYIGILNKHLFGMIENLENIQQYEIARISERLDSLEYKLSTVRSIKSKINRFFKYHAKHGISIDLSGMFYPKSMVFAHEVDLILNTLVREYKSKRGLQRLGKHHEYNLLQLKVLVLLGFYCGLRFNELRTLSIDSIYKYGNTLYVDINSKSIKKAGLKLKTINAKRRVESKISVASHEKIIQEWLTKRESIEKTSIFAFLEISKNNGFTNRVIKGTTFIYLNQVIKEVTQRYCTFHSLRHSFVTYRCKDFFPNGNNYPYSLLELSQVTGHQTPDTTLSSYMHGGLLFVNSSTNK